tara:strand:+ start:640 stop:903 length:264 start_codon:yes stop_codon:yes gene_type:complete
MDSEKPIHASEVEANPSNNNGPVYDTYEKADYNRTGAIDAEKVEFDMTVMQAVKAYPAASWWAFVMSCTIVSSSHHHIHSTHIPSQK